MNFYTKQGVRMKFYMIAFLSAAIVASNFAIQAEETTAKTVETIKNVAKKGYTQDDVLNLLNDAASQIDLGGIYASAENPENQYQVLTVALDNGSLEQYVVYQDLFGVYGVWVCPLSDWFALVNGADVEDVVVYDEEVSLDEAGVVNSDVQDENCDDAVCDAPEFTTSLS